MKTKRTVKFIIQSNGYAMIDSSLEQISITEMENIIKLIKVLIEQRKESGIKVYF